MIESYKQAQCTCIEKKVSAHAHPQRQRPFVRTCRIQGMVVHKYAFAGAGNESSPVSLASSVTPRPRLCEAVAKSTIARAGRRGGESVRHGSDKGATVARMRRCRDESALRWSGSGLLR